jgi:hypothetical protein
MSAPGVMGQAPQDNMHASLATDDTANLQADKEEPQSTGDEIDLDEKHGEETRHDDYISEGDNDNIVNMLLDIYFGEH